MSDDFNLEDLPERAQEYIRDLRKESAKYRTERNDLRTKYEDQTSAVREANEKFKDFEKLQGDHEKTLSTVSKLTEENGRMKAAGKRGIFSEYERLVGEKPEDWEKDAEQLAEKFSSSKGGGSTIPKDDAATKKPADAVDTPLKKAFQEAGFKL